MTLPIGITKRATNGPSPMVLNVIYDHSIKRIDNDIAWTQVPRYPNLQQDSSLNVQGGLYG